MKKVGGMIPDSLWRCRVIRKLGTTAREGLVRGYVIPLLVRKYKKINIYIPIGSLDSDNKYLCNLYSHAQLHAFIFLF